MLFFIQVLFVCVVGVICDLEHRNLGLLPTDCGVSNEDYIITAIPSLDEFPWMAVIAYDVGNTTKFACTGTIINAQHILTSAQCVQNIAYVRVGEYDLSTQLDCVGDDFVGLDCLNNTQDIKVEEYIVHENFRLSYNSVTNDIALLRLKNKIDFSFDNVGPICLPVLTELQNVSIDKDRGTIVVWGLNKTNSTAMRKYNIWLTPVEECYSKCNRSRLSNSKYEFENEYCVRKEDLYIADIGGPLLFKNINGNRGYIQYGVTSQQTAEYVFYTDVTKYVDWILESIKE